MAKVDLKKLNQKQKQREIIVAIPCVVCPAVFGGPPQGGEPDGYPRTMIVYETARSITGRCKWCETRIFINGLEAQTFILRLKEKHKADEGLREKAIDAALDLWTKRRR